MDYKYKQLEQQVSALGKVFADLGSQLSEVARQIAAPGAVPPAKLIDQIQAARTNFETVCAAVHGHAASMLVSPLPKAGDIGSISAIADLLKLSASSEENKFSLEGERERAMAILSNVLGIRHREQADFKPLQECHAKIAELKGAVANVLWPQRHPQSESITSLKHPSTALLSFVENLDTLEDDRWMALETVITEHYGKPLFVAASRGKLTVAPAKPAEKPAEKPAAPPAAVEKKPAPQPAVAVATEKKETVLVAPKPAPAPAPVAQPAPVAATPVAPPPVAATPIAVAVASASPAVAPPPTAVAASVPAAAPARPVAPVAPPTIAPLTNSLTALATATETPNERKLPSESVEKQRKEPRLASPAPQMATKSETKQAEPVSEEPALAGDGSQRPQRWGFWRGNR